MSKLKLQVLLVPESFADLRTELLDFRYTRKFLHITDPQTLLSVVSIELSKRYKKLYPDGEDLRIERLQDNDLCDLDPDFEAGDVFNSGQILRVVVINNMHRNGPESETPFAFKSVDLAQSTPILPPAPILTSDPKCSSGKKTQEYFEKFDSNIPSKSVNPSLWSQKNNGDRLINSLGNISMKIRGDNETIQSSNDVVSFPPPRLSGDWSVPIKRNIKLRDSSGLEQTRITSGMLSLPPHAKLEQDDISHRLLSGAKNNVSIHNNSDIDLSNDLSMSSIKTNEVEPSINAATVPEIAQSFDDQRDLEIQNVSSDMIHDKKYRSNSSNLVDTISREEVIKMFRKGLNYYDTKSRKKSDASHDKKPSSLLKSLEIDMVNGGMPSTGGRRKSRFALKPGNELDNNSNATIAVQFQIPSNGAHSSSSKNVNSLLERGEWGVDDKKDVSDDQVSHINNKNGEVGFVTKDINADDTTLQHLIDKLKSFEDKLNAIAAPGCGTVKLRLHKDRETIASVAGDFVPSVNLTNGNVILPSESNAKEKGSSYTQIPNACSSSPQESKAKENKAALITEEDTNTKRTSKRKQEEVTSTSESSDESADSDLNEIKRPRLAAFAPTPSVKSVKSKPVDSPGKATSLNANRTENSNAKDKRSNSSSSQGSEGYHTPDNVALENETSSKKNNAEGTYIRKPKLTSLQDLAQRGLPDVRDSARKSSKFAQVTNASGHKMDDSSSDGDSSSDSDESESDSSSGSSNSSDGSRKFLSVKDLNGKKKTRKKSAFYSLLKDSNNGK